MEELWRRPRVARTQAGVARTPSHECLPDLEQESSQTQSIGPTVHSTIYHSRSRVSMLSKPCILQYKIHFTGSRRSSRDRLMLSELCILRYLINFPGYWRSSGDRSMLFKPCVLQYIIDFTGSRRSSRDRSMLSKPCILQYMIKFPGYWRSS